MPLAMLLARTPDFRNFVDYLKRNPPGAPVSAGPFRGAAIIASGAGAAVGLLPVFYVLLAGVTATFGVRFFGGGAMALVSALVAGLVGYRVSQAVAQALPRLSPEELAARQKRSENLRTFHDLMSTRRLGRNVDPMVIQMLEAAAVHYVRVQAIANGPLWGAGATGHRAELRGQILKASEEAMDELLDLGRSCIGEPQREDQVQDLLGGMATFDFAEAISRLKGMVSADAWVDGAHRSPNASVVFEPMRDIAERLKFLADELEQTPTMPLDQRLSESPSTLALDSLLAEVKAVREAEEELQQRL